MTPRLVSAAVGCPGSVGERVELISGLGVGIFDGVGECRLNLLDIGVGHPLEGVVRHFVVLDSVGPPGPNDPIRDDSLPVLLEGQSRVNAVTFSDRTFLRCNRGDVTRECGDVRASC